MMVEPMITSQGNTYEKEAIEKFVKEKGIDYLTGEKMKVASLAPNLALKNSIHEFLTENPWAFDYLEVDSVGRLTF